MTTIHLPKKSCRSVDRHRSPVWPGHERHGRPAGRAHALRSALSRLGWAMQPQRSTKRGMRGMLHYALGRQSGRKGRGGDGMAERLSNEPRRTAPHRTRRPSSLSAPFDAGN